MNRLLRLLPRNHIQVASSYSLSVASIIILNLRIAGGSCSSYSGVAERLPGTITEQWLRAPMTFRIVKNFSILLSPSVEYDSAIIGTLG